MNVKLTTTSTKREVIVNWDNVEFVKEGKSPYGDEYVEVHFGDQLLDVKETLEEIENILTGEKNGGIL